MMILSNTTVAINVDDSNDGNDDNDCETFEEDINSKIEKIKQKFKEDNKRLEGLEKKIEIEDKVHELKYEILSKCADGLNKIIEITNLK